MIYLSRFFHNLKIKLPGAVQGSPRFNSESKLRGMGRRRIKYGFTLVEMLVAVAILVGSIVGPIFLAAQGIAVATEAKNRILAAYLADEAIEFVKNKRDGNLLNGESWLAGFEQCQGQDNKCSVDVWTEEIKKCSEGGCFLKVFQNSGNGFYLRYGHAGSQTSFSLERNFFYEKISDEEIKITAGILWKEKTLSRSFELSEYMYKWN
jgi:prepilin-type N-terminal cleavage/methylation domain-containing protein